MKTSYSRRHLGCVLSGIALAVVTIAMPAHATVIFSDGGEHDIDTPFEDFEVHDTPPGKATRVWVLPGGDINALDGTSVSVFDNSKVDIGGTLQGSLMLFDRSDGFVGYLEREARVLGDVELNGLSDVTVWFGTITGKTELKDRSEASIWGGIFQGDVECQDACEILFFDGVLQGAIRVQDEGEIYARGGTFQGLISAADAATVKLHGRDFLVNGVPVGYGPISVSEGTISGTLIRGHRVSTTFTIAGDAQIVLMPEPSSMLLAAIGLFGILLYPRRR